MEIKHTDKCRWWNDEEFCDCGALVEKEFKEENNRLRAELDAERKRTETLLSTQFNLTQAEEEIEGLKVDLKLERKKVEEAEAGLAEFTVMQQCLRESEAQAEVLREALVRIAEWPVVAQQHIAKKALANIPDEAKKVKAVLEAAGKLVDGETGSAELSEAVLRWREM